MVLVCFLDAGRIPCDLRDMKNPLHSSSEARIISATCTIFKNRDTSQSARPPWSPPMDLRRYLAQVPDYDRFLTVDEMHAGLDRLAADYPDITTLRRVGTSTLGEPIRMLSVGSGSRHALLFGCPHPNEPIGGMLIHLFLRTGLPERRAAGCLRLHLAFHPHRRSRRHPPERGLVQRPLHPHQLRAPFLPAGGLRAGGMDLPHFL